VTRAQALTIVINKLAQMQPRIAWSSPDVTTPAVVEEVANLTQVYDAVRGRLLYQRSDALDAWVVEIHLGDGAWGFGLVSNTRDVLCTSAGVTCNPPGVLLAAQAYAPPRPNPSPAPTCVPALGTCIKSGAGA
jgi:hypothetical protein